MLSGESNILRLNGVSYGQGSSFPVTVEFKVPPAAERQTGTPITLRIKAPNTAAPDLTLALSGATQRGDTTNYRIDFDAKILSGANFAILPTDKITCAYSRQAIMTPKDQEALGCSLKRNEPSTDGLFNFGFFPSDASRLQYREATLTAFEALTGKKWSPQLPPTISSSTTSQAPNAPATPAAKTVLSTDPKAIFGMMVGTPRPAMTFCPDDLTHLPADIPLCRSQAGTQFAALLSALKSEPNVLDHEKMGLTLISVFANSRVFDTRFTDNVQVYVDAANVMQRIKVSPRLVADREVMSMLTMKYGQPGKQTLTTWTSPQGGVVSKTPNYFWTFPNVLIDYYSRDTTIADKLSTAGGIDVYTPAYVRLAEEYQKRRGAPAPGKNGM
ncbi:hypothetical protein F183_A50570 [Bryobacterales bacterium F-183]|nr:hypothetical protein F183_A50570 [Bryobacterales bacterium F-183]